MFKHNILPLLFANLIALPIFAFELEDVPWNMQAIKAPQAWALGHLGEGVKILILDSGIDRDHPDLKDSYERGGNFTKDSDLPYPEAEPKISQSVFHYGIGTYFSGIVGGIRGVAPKARIYMAKVCDKNGRCNQESTAQALRWGIEQQVDVILIAHTIEPARLDGMEDFYGIPELFKAAIDRQIAIVVLGRDNDGKPSGRPSASWDLPQGWSVDDLLSFITVDPLMRDLKHYFDPAHIPMRKELADPAVRDLVDVAAPSVDVVSALPIGSKSFPVLEVEHKDGSLAKYPIRSFFAEKWVDIEMSKFFFVDEYIYESFGWPVAGKIVVLQRGPKFTEMHRYAHSAGAVGVVVVNSTVGPGRTARDIDFERIEMPQIPMAMIEPSIYEAIKGSNKMAIRFENQILHGVKGSPRDTFVGTSTAHVAGVVALMKSANPKASLKTIREVIVNTAQPLPDGGRLINAEAAVRGILQEK